MFDDHRALRDLEVAEAIEILGIATLAAKVDRLADLIHTFKEQIMATVEQLTADFQTYQGDVTAALGSLQTNVDQLKSTVQDLQNQIANGDLPASAQAAVDNLDAQVQAADATLKSAPAAPGDGSNPADGNPTV